MTLHTRVGFLKRLPAGSSLGYGNSFVTSRESVVATLPIGYEDGVFRALSNRGRVLVGGRYAPIVGRVSMDLIMVDVTDVPGVGLDDEVVMIGRQGGLEISLEEVAELAGTLSYEVACGISDRVPRVYKRQISAR
jgi:alanine racemase